MQVLIDLAILVAAFIVILAGAELFTNGIEWLGEKMGLSEGMIGSVLAAVGTALPETMIPIIAIILVGTSASEQVGIGAILGAPFLLAMYIIAIGLGLPYFDKPFWLRLIAGIGLVSAYALYVKQTASDPRMES